MSVDLRVLHPGHYLERHLSDILMRSGGLMVFFSDVSGNGIQENKGNRERAVDGAGVRRNSEQKGTQRHGYE